MLKRVEWQTLEIRCRRRSPDIPSFLSGVIWKGALITKRDNAGEGITTLRENQTSSVWDMLSPKVSFGHLDGIISQ